MVWNIFYFSIQLRITIPTDEVIFFRGVCIPPTSHSSFAATPNCNPQLSLSRCSPEMYRLDWQFNWATVRSQIHVQICEVLNEHKKMDVPCIAYLHVGHLYGKCWYLFHTAYGNDGSRTMTHAHRKSWISRLTYRSDPQNPCRRSKESSAKSVVHKSRSISSHSHMLHISGWWFGTCFFPDIWNHHPNWLIFFRGVETTNQICNVYPHLSQAPLSGVATHRAWYLHGYSVAGRWRRRRDVRRDGRGCPGFG